MGLVFNHYPGSGGNGAIESFSDAIGFMSVWRNQLVVDAVMFEYGTDSVVAVLSSVVGTEAFDGGVELIVDKCQEVFDCLRCVSFLLK